MAELQAQGLNNGEIARRLHLSSSTVKYHLQRLCDCFGVRERTRLVVEAIPGGYLT
ncbi:MAG: response regulator transcription factor [Armatimonadetes bacterium]|nr:response regulator transcription factor [Armatimonadota bacterium]